MCCASYPNLLGAPQASWGYGSRFLCWGQRFNTDSRMSDCACSTVGVARCLEQRLNGGAEGWVSLKHAARDVADFQQLIVGACTHNPVAVVHRSSVSQEGFRPGLLSRGAGGRCAGKGGRVRGRSSRPR